MTKDEWRLLRYGLLAALLMILVLVPIHRHKSFPGSLAEIILGCIAVAVFALIQIHGAPAKIGLIDYAGGIAPFGLSA
jgi:hypothetical protein